MNYYAFLLAFIPYVFLALAYFVYFSLEEWILHKYVMHNIKLKKIGEKWPKLRFLYYAYHSHDEVHHDKFKSDKTYHLPEGADEKSTLIPMAWWNGHFLVIVGSIPTFIVSFFVGNWWISLLSICVGYVYYGVYEYLHWCFHLPKKRRIEKGWIFQKLNGHHLLHHRYKKTKNFNVVFPFWDWIFRTLLSRSPIAFKQAKGQSVPDVQPIEPKKV